METKYLKPGYTMTDLGYIQYILEHVRNPAKTMMIEDYNSGAMLYQESYRDLPIELLTCHDLNTDKKISDIIHKLADLVFDTDFVSEIEKLEKKLPGIEAIDWGFHEPTLVPGHQYFCTLFLAENSGDEIKYLTMLLKNNHDDKSEFLTWYGNAIATLASRGIMLPGVQMYRAMYWMEHLAMFTHDGCENPHADEWTNTHFIEIVSQVAKCPFPFYTSNNFGSKKKKKDTWLVNKRKAGSKEHTKAPGRIMDDAPIFTKCKVKVKKEKESIFYETISDKGLVWKPPVKIDFAKPGKLKLGTPKYIVPHHRPKE